MISLDKNGYLCLFKIAVTHDYFEIIESINKPNHILMRPLQTLTIIFGFACALLPKLSGQIVFNDATLEDAVRTALGIPTADITQANMDTLTTLSASFPTAAITDLTGLETASALTELRLDGNAITNLGPLANLTTLTELSLSSNQISNLASLTSLTNLTELSLGSNLLTDSSNLSVLANLTSLTSLNLFSNNISDLSSLANLTTLTTLNLFSNNISDITSLNLLVNLTFLNLGSNLITNSTNLSGLGGFTALNNLDLSNNQLTDLSPLGGLSTLTFLNLGSNQISNLTPLATLTSLLFLELDSNQISDLGPLSSLTSLVNLVLSSNQISNLSPLSTLLSLFSLNLDSNRIIDLTPLGGLTGLVTLGLNDNQISDLSPLTTLNSTVFNFTLGLTLNFLDTSSGSAARIIIDDFQTDGATVTFDPQSVPDASLIFVLKEKFFFQDSAAGAVPDSQFPWGANAFIEESATDSIPTAPTITPPGLTPITLMQLDPGAWEIEDEDRATQAELDTTFPNGTYTVNYTGANNGLISGNLSVTGDAYPNVPQLTQTSFNDLQTADLSQAITLTWDTFTTGDANDLILLFIEDGLSGDEITLTGAAPGDLDGTVTSFTIPAATLAADGSYEICIIFVKVTDSPIIGGINAIGGYLSETCLKVGDFKKLNLDFIVNDGFFGQFTGTSGSLQSTAEFLFPLFTSYNLNFGFEDDGANFPAFSTVTFDGPAGSNVTNLAADSFFGPPSGTIGFGFYPSSLVATPTMPSGADTYSVTIGGNLDTTRTFDVLTALTHQLVAVPTFHLAGDDTTVDSFTLAYKLPDGATPTDTSFIKEIFYSVFDNNGAVLHEAFGQTPTTTIDLSTLNPAINAADVAQFHFSYNDFDGNSYRNSVFALEPPLNMLFFPNTPTMFAAPAGTTVDLETITYPVPLGYNLQFHTLGTSLPDVSEIVFSDPTGADLNNTPAAFVNFFGQDIFANSPTVDFASSLYPSSGTYTATFQAQDFTLNADTTTASAHNRVIVPTVTLDTSGFILNVSWVYNDPQTGNAEPLDFTPVDIQFRMSVLTFDSFVQLNGLPSGTTSVDLTANGISWNDVNSVDIQFRDQEGFTYNSFWSTSRGIPVVGDPDDTAPFSSQPSDMFTLDVPAAGDFFGLGIVALDANNFATGTEAGDVKVFNRTTGFLKALTPAGGPFGNSSLAALDADNILLGSESVTVNTVAGAGAVFFINVTTGVTDLAIENPEPEFDDAFGISTAVMGPNLIAIGADLDNTATLNNSGSVYLFDATGTPDATNPTIRHPNPASGDQFGLRLAAVSADLLLIGVPRGELDEGTNQPGSAFLYDNTDQSLTEIVNPAPVASDRFGLEVASQAGNLIVGAPQAGTGGKAYIFDQAGNLLQTLANPQDAPGEGFGTTITPIGTELILISAVQEFDGAIPPTLAGRAYLFDLDGNLLATFTNPNPTIGDIFGVSAASFGTNDFLVSSPGDDTNGTDSGKIFLFTLNTFDQWAVDKIADTNQRGMNDDPGGNGVSNLLAYAFGMPPLATNRLGLPTFFLDGTTLNVDHQRIPNAIDVIYTYESSPDLSPGSWTTQIPDSAQITPGGSEFDDVHLLFELAPNTDQQFFRVVVTPRQM